jgi:uncharacterized membrane protein
MLLHIFLALGGAEPFNTAKAEVVDWGSYKDEYKVGDTATADIAIKNTGDKDIQIVELKGSIEMDFLGKFIRLIGDSLIIPINKIGPGQTERFSQSGKIPNFPGKYRITVKVLADGQVIGDFQKIITVTR